MEAHFMRILGALWREVSKYRCQMHHSKMKVYLQPTGTKHIAKKQT